MIIQFLTIKNTVSINGGDFMDLPLKGIRILDLTRLLPGGFCTLILSDLGAEVIKVEQPGLGDYIRWFKPFVGNVSVFHYTINRGKKSVILDLKKDEDQRRFHKLVKKSDVVIESFRSGVAERLGVDFNTLIKHNPKLVYCSIRGSIMEGDDKPIHDLNAQGLSGILNLMEFICGKIDKVPLPIADLASGALCAISVLAGLLEAKVKGNGVKLEVGLVESSIFWNIVALSIVIGGVKLNDFFGLKKVAYYDVFETKDGEYITVASIEEKFWSILLNKLGIRVSDRESADAYQIVKNRIGNMTLKEIKTIFREEPACVEPVYSPREVIENTEFKHVIKETKGKVKVIATPIKLLDKVLVKVDDPPELGEDQEMVSA